MGTTSSLLSVLLMTVIDFVIRHVEANGRAVTEAMVRLQVAAAERANRSRICASPTTAGPASPEAGGNQGRGAALPLARAARRAGTDADRAQAAPAARRARDRAGERHREPEHRADRAGRRSDLPRPQDLGRSSPAAARRGRAGLRAARLSGEPGGRSRAWRSTSQADEPGPGTAARLPADLEIACFRVVQESITNALRHAAARRLEVRIVRSATAHLAVGRGRRTGLRPGTLDEAAAQRPPRRARNARANQGPWFPGELLVLVLGHLPTFASTASACSPAW